MKYFFFLFLLLYSTLFSQIDTKILQEKTEIFVVSSNKIKIHKYAKKVIYDNVDNNNSYFHINYQEDHKPKIKYIKIYDLRGNLLKNVYKSEIFHTNMSPNYVLYTDFFNCYYELKRPELPYVIEYEYEHFLENFISIPDWNPLSYNSSLVNSEYWIYAPKDMDIDYKCYNFNPKYSTELDGNEIIHKWTLKADTLVSNKEDFRNKINYGFPSLLIKTKSLFIKDAAGSFSTWKDFGDFYYELNVDRKEIPESLKKKLLMFKERYRTDVKLLSRIYKYLQETKRYISINLDLSGYQSMKVTDVDEKAFGDCKALSNYLESCLNFVGIESYSALVKGARNEFKFDSNFVNNQFNHVISCSIIDNDTIWLESTSKNSPVGYLGSFTCDRPALIIKKNASKLVYTPKYLNDNNYSKINVKAVLKEFNAADLYFDLKFYGVNQERFRGQFNKATDSNIKKYLQTYFSYLGNFSLKSYSIENISHDSAFVHFKVLIEKPDFYQNLGSNYLLNFDIFKPLNTVPTLDSERSEDVFFPYGIKEKFIVDVDFSKLAIGKVEVQAYNKIVESIYAKALVTIGNDVENHLKYSLVYSINTFHATRKEFNVFENELDEIMNMFGVKIVVNEKL